MRAFSDADLIQANTGSDTAVSTETVTVPAGVAQGDTGIIVMFAETIITPPDQWDIVANIPNGLLTIMCRADLGGGESSWQFTSLGSSIINFTWTSGEWSNIASAPLESSSSSSASSSSVSTGSTAAFAAEFVMGIAAFGIINTGTAPWPTVAYSSGFTETDVVQIGDGTANNDMYLSVARRYGTDGDTGPWSCTATYTGSMTNKTVYASLAVFRAEDTADPPLAPLTS